MSLLGTLPSRFQIGEDVSHHGRACKIEAIKFTETAIVYDIRFPDEQVKYNVYSGDVSTPDRVLRLV